MTIRIVWKRPAFAAAIAATLLLALPSQAQPVTVDRPLDGYSCALLNVPDAQMRDPQWAGVPILTAPSPSAPRGTMASGIVVIRNPAHVVGGFAEVLQRTGKPGWIEAGKIVPYKSKSHANATCTPALLSNGRIGTS